MRTRRGLTLLEVVIVIALLGVLAALVWPDLSSWQGSAQLEESGSRLKALVGMCRAQSMLEARRYRLRFRVDGSLRLSRQLDPILAPQTFVKVRDTWTRQPFLLEDVWVEAVLPLPEGPPPIEVEDELIEFDEFSEEPIPVTELEQAVDVYFEPDGVSGSARWILRSTDGRGLRMTLDGRLGRVVIEPAERVERESLERPDPLPEEEEQPTEAELLAELEEERP